MNSDSDRQDKKTPKRSFSVSFKLEVVNDAEKSNNNTGTARKYGLDVKQVRTWRRKKSELEQLVTTAPTRKKARKSVSEPARKSSDEREQDTFTDELAEWLTEQSMDGDSSTKDKAEEENTKDADKNDCDSTDTSESDGKGEKRTLDGDAINPEETVIKLSPSDLEMSDSDDDDDARDFMDSDDEVQVKAEIDSDDYGSSSVQSEDDDDNSSLSWKDSSEEDTKKRKATKLGKLKSDTEKLPKKETKRKLVKSPKPKRPRGRPKQPRRLIVPEGAAADYTSEEGEDVMKPVLRTGSGYPVEFKLRVLKYAESHSNSATAEKFGLQPKRIRDWKRSSYKIQEESKGEVKRRPRTEGYTVQEKLQAVAFAAERSTDEARLLYNVDRRTIEKWRAKKEQLEARLLQGEGDCMRRAGSGRKPKYTRIEESLRDWIVTLRLKGVTMNYKMILNKAKMFIEQDISLQDVPVPRTRTWVIGFLKRQNLHGLLGNTLGHEDPRELLNVELKTGEGDLKSLAERLVEIPENPNKRNRRTISLEDKVNIIRRIEQGETQGTVAKSLKVATSTIQTIWSCRNEILHRYVNPKSKSKSDALVWKIYSVIGSSLRDWLEQNITKLGKVDSSVLMEKAIQLAETYRLPQFSTEAKQWLRVFCKKNNLSDVLAELRGNYTGGNPSNNVSSHVTAIPQCPPSQQQALHPPGSSTTTAINSVESDDHHNDDDFHPSDFNENFNVSDYLLAMQNDAQVNRSQSHTTLQPPLPHHQHHQSISNSSSVVPHQGHHLPHSVPTENLNHPRFLPNAPTVVTTTDAVKYISLLRSWIQSSYGPTEEILNNHLSVVENAVLKKRISEASSISHSNNSINHSH